MFAFINFYQNVITCPSASESEMTFFLDDAMNPSYFQPLASNRLSPYWYVMHTLKCQWMCDHIISRPFTNYLWIQTKIFDHWANTLWTLQTITVMNMRCCIFLFKLIVQWTTKHSLCVPINQISQSIYIMQVSFLYLCIFIAVSLLI